MPNSAVREPLLHLDDRRFEAAFVADGKLHLRLMDGADGTLCVCRGGAQRLFAEHMPPGFRRGFDLSCMMVLRGAQDDGFDILPCQRVFKTRRGLNAKLCEPWRAWVREDRYPAQA